MPTFDSPRSEPSDRTRRSGSARLDRESDAPSSHGASVTTSKVSEAELLKLVTQIYAGQLYAERSYVAAARGARQSSSTDPAFLSRTGAVNSSHNDAAIRIVERVARDCRDARSRMLVAETLARGRFTSAYVKENRGRSLAYPEGDDWRRWDPSIRKTEAYSAYRQDVIRIRRLFADTIGKQLLSLGYSGDTKALERSMGLPPRTLPSRREPAASTDKVTAAPRVYAPPVSGGEPDTKVLLAGERKHDPASTTGTALDTKSRLPIRRIELTDSSVIRVKMPIEAGGHEVAIAPSFAFYRHGSEVRKLAANSVSVLDETAGVRVVDRGKKGVVMEFTKPGDFIVYQKDSRERYTSTAHRVSVAELPVARERAKLAEGKRYTYDRWGSITSGAAGWKYAYSSDQDRLYARHSSGAIRCLDARDGSWHVVRAIQLPTPLAGSLARPPAVRPPEPVSTAAAVPKPAPPVKSTAPDEGSVSRPSLEKSKPPAPPSDTSRVAIKQYRIPPSSVILIKMPLEYGGHEVSFAPSSSFFKHGSDVQSLRRNTTVMLDRDGGIRVRDCGSGGVIVEFTKPGTFVLRRKGVMERGNYARYTLPIEGPSREREQSKLTEAKEVARDTWSTLRSGTSTWQYTYSTKHDRLYARGSGGTVRFFDETDGSWHNVPASRIPAELRPHR